LCGASAELSANLRQRSSGELLDDVHRHLARKSNRSSVTANFQILLPQIKMLAYPFLDQIDRDTLFLRSDDVSQHLLRRPSEIVAPVNEA